MYSEAVAKDRSPSIVKPKPEPDNKKHMLDAQQRLQLSPPYVHEGVGDVENFFLHQVPSANALLSAAPDLGENHFAQAMCYVIDTKKSVWLARRNKVITECVEHGECEPIHIGEADMVADSFTKYVKRETWARHMHYVLNLPGDPPDCHPEGWVRVPSVKNKSKPKVAYKA